MSLSESLAYLGRWLEFLAVLLFVGNVLFRAAVLSADAVRRFDARLYGAALAVLTLTTPLDLFVSAAQFSEGTAGDMFRMLPAFIIGTHVGRIWLIKAGALLLGWTGLILGCTLNSPGLRRWLLPLAAGLWVMALSLSGHAADEQILSLSTAAHVAHVTAAAAWIGGLLPLVYTLRLAGRSAFADILEKFSTLATASVGGILVSGGYLAWLSLPDAPMLPGNLYGRALLVKLGLIAVIVGLGGLNKMYMLPRLRLATETAGDGLRRRTLMFLAAEATLAVAVLGCAAILAQSSPEM